LRCGGCGCCGGFLPLRVGSVRRHYHMTHMGSWLQLPPQHPQPPHMPSRLRGMRMRREPEPVRERAEPRARLPHRYLHHDSGPAGARALSKKLRGWAPPKLRIHSDCSSCQANGIRRDAERVAELVPPPKLLQPWNWPQLHLLISLCSKCYAELIQPRPRGRGCPKVQDPSAGERRRSTKKPQMPKSGDF
jgi:hypothetical protein